MLGGRDKDLPWDDLAQLIHKRVDHVILFGEAAPKIAFRTGSANLRAAAVYPPDLQEPEGSHHQRFQSHTTRLRGAFFAGRHELRRIQGF